MKKNKIQDKICRLSLIAGVIFLASGCAQVAEMTGQTEGPPSCADRVISRAFDLHGEAKSGLALFFEEHNDNRLYQAFYAAWDSVNAAHTVKKCWDRRVSHFYAMQNLQEMNTLLARVIRRNMPDEDPGDLIAIYREQYDQVMRQQP